MNIKCLSGTDWEVSHFLPGEVNPASALFSRLVTGKTEGGFFIPSAVPGDVQSDLLDAGVIEDINYGFNARKAEWTYQRDWLYIKRFSVDEKTDKTAYLCFDGVDSECDVFLNGKWLGSHENAFIPFKFHVTDILNYDRENVLAVVVKHAKDQECQWGHTSKVKHLKARFAYGWDWCTRLVPLGIWKDVYLKFVRNSMIEDVYVKADVDYIGKKAKVVTEVLLDKAYSNSKIDIELSLDGTVISKKTITTDSKTAVAEADVEAARLWFPNGMGEQPLYQVKVLLNDSDLKTVNVGLKHLEFKRTENAPADAIPYQPYINGRRVYLQGYNFTPIRQLYGRKHSEAYNKQISLVKKAGANYLRIWGGGLLEREELYDLCDKNGILLMQELFQSSADANNHPSVSKEYTDMMKEAARSAVLQKRNHPCLIAWCGGNELCFRGKYIDSRGNTLIDGIEGYEGLKYDVSGFDWIPLDAEYPTLSAMRDTVKELDSERLWLHTSGSGPYIQNADLRFTGGKMHDVHGPWTVLGPTEAYDVYNKLDMMLHHEFGCQGSASVQTIESVAPEEYRWPLDEDNPMVNYRGRMFANGFSLIKPYFGEINDMKRYVTASRFIQWEQLRYALEAHRRLGKACAGACLWQLSEPWPNLTGTCSIDMFNQVKPAYYGETAAFRPVHASLHYDTLIHKAALEFDVALSNNTAEEFAGNVKTEVFDIFGNLIKAKDVPCRISPDSQIHTLFSECVENLPDGLVFIRYTLSDSFGNEVENGYSVHSSDDIPYRRLTEQEDTDVIAGYRNGSLFLTNNGKKVVSGICVECENDKDVYFSEGCIMILPGETKKISVECEKLPELYISGFGVPYSKIRF